MWAYNLETVLAEKLETMIARTVTNTRMRDFYDVHILCGLYADSLDAAVLHDALAATAKKRGSVELMQDAAAVFDEVEQNPVMEKLWLDADGISWHQVMTSVRRVFDMGAGV